jgi:hypothetical protein
MCENSFQWCVSGRELRARDVRRCVPPGGRGNVSAVFGGAVLAQITVQVLGDQRQSRKTKQSPTPRAGSASLAKANTSSAEYPGICAAGRPCTGLRASTEQLLNKTLYSGSRPPPSRAWAQSY